MDAYQFVSQNARAPIVEMVDRNTPSGQDREGPSAALTAESDMKTFLATLLFLSAPLATPQDLERSVAAMVRVGFCSGPSFSPDGRRIAFVSNMTGIPQIFTVATAGGWPEQVTAFEDPVGGVSWSPEGSWLAFSLAPGGGMNQQVYLARPDGSGVKG
jgi:dipeptidyl aminopeptidase/acylaminoacyl peptidase